MREVFAALQLPRDPHARIRGHGTVRARSRRRHRHRLQGNVHVGRQGARAEREVAIADACVPRTPPASCAPTSSTISDRAGLLQKLYYIGPQFRRERPQKGRYRQFYQIGAEVIGPPSAGSELAHPRRRSHRDARRASRLRRPQGLDAAPEFRRLRQRSCRATTRPCATRSPV